MYQLTYASKAVGDVHFEVVESIAKKALETNKPLGVTGFLVFNSKYFLQALEGPRHAVNDLYARIAGDQRHEMIEILSYKSIGQRSFPAWSMAAASAKSFNKELYLKYSESDEFNPYALTDHGSTALLVDLYEQFRHTK